MSGKFPSSVAISLCLACNLAVIPCLAKSNQNQASKSQKAKASPTVQKPRSSPQASFNSSAAGSYLDRLRERMDKNWYLADGKNHVVINAVILADGSVENVELSSTPKNEAAEQAANEAFLKAQPLESLPSGTQGKCRIILDMDSYADPHGDSQRTVKSRMEVIREKTEPAKEPAKE